MNNYQAATSMEYAHIELEDILSALEVLDTAMETAYPWGKQDDNALMKNFAETFPLFFSTYRIIRRDLCRVTDELKNACNLAYKGSRTEEKRVIHGTEE